MIAEALVGGDPVSCSRVGGSLRRHAGRLADRCAQLDRLVQELAEAAPVAPGRDADDQAVDVAAVQTELALVAAAAADLDAAGALLQRYATELSEAQAQAGRVARSVAAAGLTLDDGRVVEPWGPASSDVAVDRREVIPRLQGLSERVLAAAGRARGTLQRGAHDCRAALARRSGELRGIPDGRSVR